MIYIWANYNISLTWNKAMLGWFPLLTMIPVRENSEVVIIYPYIYIYVCAMVPIYNWNPCNGYITVCVYAYVYTYVNM